MDFNKDLLKENNNYTFFKNTFFVGFILFVNNLPQ